jgi:hypothetical protein
LFKLYRTELKKYLTRYCSFNICLVCTVCLKLSFKCQSLLFKTQIIICARKKCEVLLTKMIWMKFLWQIYCITSIYTLQMGCIKWKKEFKKSSTSDLLWENVFFCSRARKLLKFIFIIYWISNWNDKPVFPLLCPRYLFLYLLPGYSLVGELRTLAHCRIIFIHLFCENSSLEEWMLELD